MCWLDHLVLLIVCRGFLRRVRRPCLLRCLESLRVSMDFRSGEVYVVVRDVHTLFLYSEGICSLCV